MHRSDTYKYWCPGCGRLLLISQYSKEREWYIPEMEMADVKWNWKQTVGDILAHIESEYETSDPDKSIAVIKDICQRSLPKAEEDGR